MSFANVGKRWSTVSFPEYLKTLSRPTWGAKSVTLHYTASPSLAQRPSGFTAQHIENIRDYYLNTRRWDRGPHFFTDDDDIFGMTPLSMRGIHAVSFNSSSIGIEALGAYDTEDPKTGRGLAVWQTTASATRALLDWLGLPINEKTVLFHRFDPKTTKTCPGKKVMHDWALQLIREAEPGTVTPTAEPDTGGYGDQILVPVVAYVVQKTKREFGDVAKMLRREGQMFFLGDSWLEGAHYAASEKTTVAPKSEVEDAIKALK